MPDEPNPKEQAEDVEAHMRSKGLTDEPDDDPGMRGRKGRTDEDDDVEAHMKAKGRTDEPGDDPGMRNRQG
jgi:hypothetical protein